MTDTTTATDPRPAATGAPITVVPLADDWAVPDDWQRLRTHAQDGERHGYAGGIVFMLDLDRRVLSLQPLSHDDRSRQNSPRGWVSWTAAAAGVAPAVLELDFLDFSTHAEAAVRSRLDVLLAEVAPLAQQIADHMAAVPGTGARDWTVGAYAAYHRASHLIDRFPYRGTRHDHPYTRPPMVDANDLFTEFPELVEPRWADLSDNALDASVDYMSRRLGNLAVREDTAGRVKVLVRRAAERYGLERAPGGVDGHLVPVGLRAWLYGYRAQRAGGRAALDASRWDGAAAVAPRVRADTDDGELAALAAEVVAAAAADGVKLVGAPAWLSGLRAARRRDVREELTRTAARIAELDAQTKPAKLRRRALVASILGWGEGDLDAALAREAGLSHTAVKSIRDTLAADDEATD